MLPIERNYAHRSQCAQKPFSFRWEVEQLPQRLCFPVGDRLDSPDFEVAPGVQIYVSLKRTKATRSGEWLSACLCMGPKSPAKEAIMNFSIALVRSPPKQDLRFEYTNIWKFTVKNDNLLCAKLVRFSDLTDPAEGFLKDDGQMLTVLVEGNVFSGEQSNEREIVLKPASVYADLETTLWKQTSETYRKLFEEGLHTDFVVKAKDAKGEMKELKVHKGVLAAGSKVFAAMLSNPELNECCEGQVEIDDVQFEVMEALIRFVYTGKFPLEKDHQGCGLANKLIKLISTKKPKDQGAEEIELDLLVAADKYQIDGLKILVECRLAASLSVENVCGRLAHAELYKAPFLKARSIEFYQQRRSEILKTEGWRQLCTRLVTPEYAHLTRELFSSDGDDEQPTTSMAANAESGTQNKKMKK